MFNLKGNKMKKKKEITWEDIKAMNAETAKILT